MMVGKRFFERRPKITHLHAYRFLVGHYCEYVYAENLDDALYEISGRCLWSFLKGAVSYLDSTDPYAPRTTCNLRPVDMFTLKLEPI